MCRPMQGLELAAFSDQFGYAPTCIRIGVDTNVVLVHQDNPLQGLTLTQVDAIFSRTRKGGAPEDLHAWGQLGLEGEWRVKHLTLFGRRSTTLAFATFKEYALFRGDFKESVQEQHSFKAVAQRISEDRHAIGYGHLDYLVPGIRALPVAESGGCFVEPTVEHCLAAVFGVRPRPRLVKLEPELSAKLEVLVRQLRDEEFSLREAAHGEIVKLGPAVLPGLLNRAQDKDPEARERLARIISGFTSYPLARGLYLYFNKPPGKPMDPLVREFLRLFLSQQGQMQVLKDGYLPLSAAIAAEERKKLE